MIVSRTEIDIITVVNKKSIREKFNSFEQFFLSWEIPRAHIRIYEGSGRIDVYERHRLRMNCMTGKIDT